mmetsp:Transcript_20269/g.71676  ORF Transcript_20269/g.71676 Transcript_20269/m.71676 type:complete len:242 (-) Transcript_20269:225-950(-)
MAPISAPMPHCGQPSSTVTRRLVFLTVATMASRSSGRSVRRLMTSTLMPSPARISAASSDRPTWREKVTMLTSLPSRSVLALPIGSTKSSFMASSLIGITTPYMSSFSRNTTGSGSRMAALMRPLASSALYGDSTLRPGTDEYHAPKHCECCAATPADAPFGPRKTMGVWIVPADMYSVLAAELTIWSMACMLKFHVMNSMMGRRPACAAPTPRPAKPISVMGVSMTRSPPNLSNSPFDTL